MAKASTSGRRFPPTALQRLCPPTAERSRADPARRGRPGRHAVRQRRARQGHQALTAYDPVAEWTTGHVAIRATAATATAFLDKLISDAPFTIEGIQVDGGSELKAAFEQACEDKGLILYMLPPKQPRLDGAVERNQGAWRYEFYVAFDRREGDQATRRSAM